MSHVWKEGSSLSGSQQTIPATNRLTELTASLSFWFIPIVSALVLWGLTSLVPPHSITIAIGAEEGLNDDYGEGRHLYSFLGWLPPHMAGDKIARAGEPWARFAIPWAFRVDHPLHIAWVMSGWNQSNPVTMRLNDTVVELPLQGSGWRRYQVLLPPSPAVYERDLYLEWRSTGEVGPLLHQVSLSPATQPNPRTVLAWPLVALVLVGILGHRSPTLPHIIWMAILTISAAAGWWLYAPQLLPWNGLAALGGGTAVLLTLLVPHLWRRVALWVLVLWVLAVPQVLGTWLLDDAFISLRYARNFIDGAGLTFNPGESVEGYTNFLWTVILAIGMKAGAEPIVTAQMLCTILALGTILLTDYLTPTWYMARNWGVVVVLLLVVNPAFLLYTARGSGMETALVTFLALVSLWRIGQAYTPRQAFLAGILCALVMMARPDGALVALAGGLVLAAESISPTQRSKALRIIGAFVAGAFLLYGPYFAWRYSYYGYLLPNTFYVKVGATIPQLVRGLHYLGDFALVQGFPLLLIPLAYSFWRTWLAHNKHIMPQRTLRVLWVFVVLTLLYVVGVGGDQFPLGRFFIPIIPPLAVLTAHGVTNLTHSIRPAAVHIISRIIVLLIVVWLALQLPATDSRKPGNPVWRQHKVAMRNVDLGLWLRLHTPPDTVVATGIAGALPYYAQRYTIDMLGLNDLHIAHMDVATMGQGIAGTEKSDPAYVLDQAPDYIPWTTAGMLKDDPRFARDYTLITVAGPRGGKLRFYQRNE